MTDGLDSVARHPPGDAVPALVGFSRALRAAGVAVGADRVRAWADALSWLDADDTANVYWTGRLTLCASPDDLRVYDTTFATFFGGLAVTRPRGQRATIRSMDGTQAPVRTWATPASATTPTTTVSASRHEVLRHRDLAMLRPEEHEEINRMLAALHNSGPWRSSRRLRPDKRGRTDPARTVRAMVRRGGEPAMLHYRARKRVPRRLVLIVDVSGSMTGYADSMLRFAHAACLRRPSTEVFTIGTRLTRVTRELHNRDPSRAIAAAGAAVPDWNGGTRLGEQLQAFLDRWGQRGTTRGAVVVVCSDGWEVGDVTLLAAQATRLQRLAHRVVWVSPHAGKDGFAPGVAGLRAVLPSIDLLTSGHSVEALADVARLLSHEIPTNGVRSGVSYA